MRHAFLALCLFLGLISSAPAQVATQSAPPPDCDYCREKLGDIETLRRALPQEWSIWRERETVFGGEILVAEAGLGNPQTLLLVHGLGQNGFTDWVSVMPQLARDYHVITLDLPGFGYSDSPSGKYSPTRYAQVVSGLLARHAKGPALVVGHSMGGAVALRLAATAPTQVSRLVLVDAAGIMQRSAFLKHSVGGRIAGANSNAALPGLLRGVLERVRDVSDATLERVMNLPDPSRALGSSDALWGRVLGGRANMNAAIALVEEDYSEAIHSLPVPTWLIWGEADPIAPLRTGQMLAWRLPQAQLLTLPGVGHVPMDAPSRQPFLRLLGQALSTAPVSPRPVSTAKPGVQDLVCRNETGVRYSGQFRELRIENCTGVMLQDVAAERIVIRDSMVQMQGAQITSAGTAIEVTNSELVATGGEISGRVAILADKARVDLAGVVLTGREKVVEVQRDSRLIASACVLRAGGRSTYWQGSQDLENAALQP